MKYIKKFYESVDNDIMDNIKDICLELNDMDIESECKWYMDNMSNGRYYKNINIDLSKPYTGPSCEKTRKIYWTSIKDVVYRIIDYIKSLGFSNILMVSNPVWINVSEPFRRKLTGTYKNGESYPNLFQMVLVPLDNLEEDLEKYDLSLVYFYDIKLVFSK